MRTELLAATALLTLTLAGCMGVDHDGLTETIATAADDQDGLTVHDWTYVDTRDAPPAQAHGYAPMFATTTDEPFTYTWIEYTADETHTTNVSLVGVAGGYASAIDAGLDADLLFGTVHSQHDDATYLFYVERSLAEAWNNDEISTTSFNLEITDTFLTSDEA